MSTYFKWNGPEHKLKQNFDFLNFFKFKVYLFLREREREREQGRGRETWRHRIWSRRQSLNRQHRAQCGAWTHKLWDHDLSWSRMLTQLSHWGAPQFFFSRNFETILISPWIHKHFVVVVVVVPVKMLVVQV